MIAAALAGKAGSETAAVQAVGRVIGAAPANSAVTARALRIAVAQAAWVVVQETGAVPFKASIAAAAQRAARVSAAAPAERVLGAVPPGVAVVQEVVVEEDGAGKHQGTVSGEQ